MRRMTLAVVALVALALAGAVLGAAGAQAPAAPARLHAAAGARPGFPPDPQVQQMISQVQQTGVYSIDGALSGEWPAVIGGQPYTITTRYTDSGTPIQKATQYAYERFQADGLAASYLNWSAGGHSSRDVIGTLTGTVRPDEIVLVTAHLDDTSDAPTHDPAPGADDNGSGSTAVLTLASIMRAYRFERTVRFVLFTGEEQGSYGSTAYAEAARYNGDNIVAVWNMDMLAWDALDGPTLRLHTQVTGDFGYPPELAIVNVFTNVLQAYNLSSVLTPILTPDGLGSSDHSRFWQQGYPAILAIEDNVDDFNTNYHTTADRLATLNMTYFTNYVRASIGTVAHLALPVAPPAGTPTPTPTATPAPCYGANVLDNPGFETGSLPPWVVDATSPAPAVVTTTAHGGVYAAALGAYNGHTGGDSALYQQVTVPASGGLLSFWYWPYSWDEVHYDWQEAEVTDTAGQVLTTVMHLGSISQRWTPFRFDMTPFAGQTVRIRFLVHDGNGYNPTYMYLDDVGLQPRVTCATPTPTATATIAPTATPPHPLYLPAVLLDGG